jgi:phosphoserine phosphatase RsbU/P
LHGVFSKDSFPKPCPSSLGSRFVAGYRQPNEVGGDCFDFIPFLVDGMEYLIVLVADASGHGIGAALRMAETLAYLRALALTGADIGTLLSLTNHRLTNDGLSEDFVTLLLVQLDPRTRSLLYASAGHCPGYILNRQGQTKAVLHSTSPPLGIGSACEFPIGPTSPLEPGDMIFLFTDGIVEASSPDGEFFGTERMLEIVRRHQQKTPDQILAAVFDAVANFSKRALQDDLTAVIIEVEDAA